MALMTPQGVSIPAFDASNSQLFSFTVQGGDQVVANRLVIKDNSNQLTVYNEKIVAYSYAHTLPANKLSNSKTYTFQFFTYNVNDDESSGSSPILFKTYASPTLTFTNLPTPSETTHIIESASWNAICQYSQVGGEAINFLNVYLYDTNYQQLDFAQYTISDAESTTSTTATFSHTFANLIDDETYYIRAVAETINNTVVNTGYIPIQVNYEYEGNYYHIQATNYANGGYVKILNNITEVDGNIYDINGQLSNPIFLSDSYLLLEHGDELNYLEGYQISNTSFVKQKWWFPVLLGETTRIYQDESHRDTYISVELKRCKNSGTVYDYILVQGYQNGVKYMQKVSNLIEAVNQTVQLISYVKIDGADVTATLQLADIEYGAVWNGESNIVLDGNYTSIDWLGEGQSGDFEDSYINIDNMQSNVEWGRLTNMYWVDEEEASVLSDVDIVGSPSTTTELYKTILKNAVINEFYITRNLSTSLLTTFPEWDNYTIMLCDFNNTINAGDVEWVLNNVDKIKVKRKLKTALNSTYITIFEKAISTAYDLDFAYKDYYVASGQDYTYVMIPCAGNVEQTYEFTTDIHTQFNGLFISDGEKTMKLYSNYGITAAQDNILVGAVQPYNSRYPIIIKNPNVLYGIYSFQGDIIGMNENQDDDGCIITNFTLNEQTRTDIVNEQHHWRDFLCDGKTKIIKDWNGNIIMAQITTAPSYTYDQISGNSKPTMTFSVTEVGQYDDQYDLYQHGLLHYITSAFYRVSTANLHNTVIVSTRRSGGVASSSVQIERIDINGTDNSVTLISGKYYQIVDSSNSDNSVVDLTVLIDSSNTDMEYESPSYHFSFKSGAIPTELVLPYDVYVPSNFAIQPNTYYDVYINPYTRIVTYYSTSEV